MQGGTIKLYEVEEDQLEVCEKALKCAMRFGRLVYARVDLVWHENTWCVGELELLDPELFLLHEKDAVKRFVDAIIDDK